ncbi:uncharacterized protein LOC120339813 [Styela clava]|uniref:uncharacterized protein LOC120339813 n=1 Tax=Styela clava TaxID=7725 RepID=UPI00193932A7|nr:uncharacterized protein LOC120339813 [Styela clava]
MGGKPTKEEKERDRREEYESNRPRSGENKCEKIRERKEGTVTDHAFTTEKLKLEYKHKLDMYAAGNEYKEARLKTIINGQIDAWSKYVNTCRQNGLTLDEALKKADHLQVSPDVVTRLALRLEIPKKEAISIARNISTSSEQDEEDSEALTAEAAATSNT